MSTVVQRETLLFWQAHHGSILLIAKGTPIPLGERFQVGLGSAAPVPCKVEAVVPAMQAVELVEQYMAVFDTVLTATARESITFSGAKVRQALKRKEEVHAYVLSTPQNEKLRQLMDSQRKAVKSREN